MRAVGYAILAVLCAPFGSAFAALAEQQFAKGNLGLALICVLLSILFTWGMVSGVLGFWWAARAHDRSRWDGWR